MKKKLYLSVAMASVLSMTAFGASAQSLVVSNTSGSVGEVGHVSTVVFTNTSPETYAGFDFRMTYNDANLTVAGPITTSDAGTACSNNVPGTILCFANPSGVDLFLKPTVTITIPFDIGATAAVEPLSLFDINAFDDSAAAVPLAGTDGSITITLGPPPDVIAGSDPADGTAISIPGGAPGDTNSTSVDINIASGSEGTVSVTSCTVGPDFTITAPGAFPANAPVTIEVEATLGAAALADTLNCVGTDSSAAGFDFSWPISAPAGTLLAGPTVSSSPSSANPLQLPTNTTGNPVSLPVTFTPNGGDVGGPDATVACAVSGPFTVAPANLTLPVGGPATSVAVGCSPGADVEAGALTCTVNDETGANDIVWELVCPAMSVAPAAPTFVPASSLWSKLALFGMLGALGMLVLGLRRNH